MWRKSGETTSFCPTTRMEVKGEREREREEVVERRVGWKIVKDGSEGWRLEGRIEDPPSLRK